ncbi:hypothetical protein HPB49_021321 [Dermacentor silvarum]|uniref:Uncharacterized protein n=1 Tax=Dermacentor silvarum TaxID=543639 RepID=A0ACB8DRC0_DERSI|nr:hypothetical protein HPB49_021321 [Dermacentor silvarum]
MAAHRYTCVGFSPKADRKCIDFVTPMPSQRLCSVCSVIPDVAFSLGCRHVFCTACMNDLMQQLARSSLPVRRQGVSKRKRQLGLRVRRVRELVQVLLPQQGIRMHLRRPHVRDDRALLPRVRLPRSLLRLLREARSPGLMCWFTSAKDAVSAS